MQINLKDTQAIVEHDGLRVLFDLKDAFQSPQKAISREPFIEINKWFASLAKPRQKAIFDIYVEFRKELTGNMNVEFLEERMTALSEALYQYVTFEPIKAFVEREQLLKIDNVGFIAKHQEDDPNPEKTYIASEYYDLTLFMLCLRPLFPISSELGERLSKVYGKDYKEHFSRIALLSNTWLMDAEPLNRLSDYVEATVEKRKDEIGNVVFNAMSREEFSSWAMSKVICRRLMSGEIHPVPGVPSQVSSIWGFIKNSVRQTPKIASVGDVAIKTPPSEGGEEVKSIMEENRVRHNTTIGFMVQNEHYLSDIGNVVRQIDPTVPHELITAAEESPLVFGVGCISRWHTVITQYLIADKVSLRILESLPKPSHVAGVEISRILLWHWGYHELALLMSSEEHPVEYEEDDTVVIGAPINHRTDADPALITRINEIYILENGKKTRPDRHPVYLTLRELCSLIPNRLWEVRPIKGEVLPESVDSLMRMKTPNDIIHQVVKLAVDLAEKRLTSGDEK